MMSCKFPPTILILALAHVQWRHWHVQHDSIKRAMTSCEAAYNSYKEAVTALRQMVEQRKTLLKYAHWLWISFCKLD